MSKLAVIGLIVISWSLGGCVSLQKKDDGKYAPVPPPAIKPRVVNNGAIFQASTARPVFEDDKARHVGDVITIILTESTNATKSASTSTSKETKTDSRGSVILGKTLGTNPARDYLGNKIDSKHEFAGKGDSAQSNSLQGTITVTVAKVYPNGYLFVRGQKRIALNQGVEYIRISGIIRPSDISANNTIASNLIADAKITYSGKGDIANSNTMGWLTRFFNSKWWPF